VSFSWISRGGRCSGIHRRAAAGLDAGPRLLGKVITEPQPFLTASAGGWTRPSTRAQRDGRPNTAMCGTTCGTSSTASISNYMGQIADHARVGEASQEGKLNAEQDCILEQEAAEGKSI